MGEREPAKVWLEAERRDVQALPVRYTTGQCAGRLERLGLSKSVASRNMKLRAWFGGAAFFAATRR